MWSNYITGLTAKPTISGAARRRDKHFSECHPPKRQPIIEDMIYIGRMRLMIKPKTPIFGNEVGVYSSIFTGSTLSSFTMEHMLVQSSSWRLEPVRCSLTRVEKPPLAWNM